MERLSHYELVEQLGEGGMGVVYKARDARLGRFVALKVLAPGKASVPERRQRFVQEAKAASALNHPNILTVHEISSENGVELVVTEYVTGWTLARLIPRNGLPSRAESSRRSRGGDGAAGVSWGREGLPDVTDVRDDLVPDEGAGRGGGRGGGRA